MTQHVEPRTKSVLQKNLLAESVVIKNFLTESVLMNFLREAVPMRSHNVFFVMNTLEKGRKSQINYQILPLCGILVLFISVMISSVSTCRNSTFRSNKMPTSFVPSEYTEILHCTYISSNNIHDTE